MEQVPSAAKRGRASHDWFQLLLRKWREFVNQSQSVVKQNQSKRKATFDIQLKKALLVQEVGERILLTIHRA